MGFLGNKRARTSTQGPQSTEGSGPRPLTLRDSAAIVDTSDRVGRHDPARLPRHSYGILRRGLVGARNTRTSDARHRRAPGEDTSVGKAVEGAVHQCVGHDRCHRRLVSPKPEGDETGAHDRTACDASSLAQRAEDPLVSMRLAKPLTTGIAGLIRDHLRSMRRRGAEGRALPRECVTRSGGMRSRGGDCMPESRGHLLSGSAHRW